ncbi:MAG TPA: DinB family protein [Puia sp.]|nr:DinB family protein [Puia sp.]
MSKKIRLIAKPLPDEYPAYASMYMKWLPDDGLVLMHLKDQAEKTNKFVSRLTKEQLKVQYAPGKWTIKEVLVHIIDDERIYAYRALRIGRGDTTPLPGFEQDNYVPYSRANERSVDSILKEYTTVRKATLSLFRSFPEEDFLRRGTADGSAMSVRALLYHLAGHELHHLHIIKERYLGLS